MIFKQKESEIQMIIKKKISLTSPDKPNNSKSEKVTDFNSTNTSNIFHTIIKIPNIESIYR